MWYSKHDVKIPYVDYRHFIFSSGLHEFVTLHDHTHEKDIERNCRSWLLNVLTWI